MQQCFSKHGGNNDYTLFKNIYNPLLDFMKKAILYISAMTLLAVSCKKEKKETDSPIPKSQWTVDGIPYKGFAKAYPIGSAFEASENFNNGPGSSNYVAIKFYYGYWPARSGIYKVKNSPVDSTMCSITVGDLKNVPIGDFNSVDSTSEVNIVVSPLGKLSASFTNVFLSNYDGTQAKTVSGSLEEQ